MPIELTFTKSGLETRNAITLRLGELQSRLDKRNLMLDDFIKDRKKIRSYLVRLSEMDFSHGRMGTPSTLYGEDDISSETKQEISQLCRRIFDLEQEIGRLTLVRDHLDDEQILKLSYNDLIQYGFSLQETTGS